MKTNILIILLLACMSLFSKELTRTKSDILIYSDSSVYINETLEAPLEHGIAEYKVKVAKNIDTASFIVKFNGEIISKKFDYESYSLNAILERNIGAFLTFEKPDQSFSGILKSVSGERIILNTKSDSAFIIPFSNIYTIKGLQTNFKTGDQYLYLTLKPKIAGKNTLELSYKAKGMCWEVFYNSVVSPDNKQMKLTSHLKLSNSLGIGFENADIHFTEKIMLYPIGIRQIFGFEKKRRVFHNNEAPAKYFDKADTTNLIFDYPKPISIDNAEEKLFLYISSDSIKVDYKNVVISKNIESHRFDNDVYIVFNFKNTIENGLGADMPFGEFRVYKNTGTSVDCVGADISGILKKDNCADIYVGLARNIIISPKYPVKLEDTNGYKIYYLESKLKNAKDSENVKIEIIHGLNENGHCEEYEVLDCNVDYKKLAKDKIALSTMLEAKSEKIVKLKIRIKIKPYKPKHND